MSEKKYDTCPECGAPCEVIEGSYKEELHDVHYVEHKYDQKTGAVWVKISERLPGKDHNYHVKATSKYQGYNHNDTAFWRNGAWEFQQSNRGYYVVEWLDESGTAAGREEDAVAFAEWLDTMRNSRNNIWRDASIWGKEDAFKLVYELFKQQKEK